jgi:hypothetical protein
MAAKKQKQRPRRRVRVPSRASAESSQPVAELRLAKTLGERLAKEGSYMALAQAISEANGIYTDEDGNRPKDAVDRRKLKSIVDNDEKLTFSVVELRALDRYLERYGHGLAYSPLFSKPDLLQSLADYGDVTFLLGSKPEEDHFRVNFSHWDVLAMGEIQRSVNAFAPRVFFDIREVRLQPDVDGARRSVDESKCAQLLAEDGPSVVSLASSRRNPASDMMLSMMCGCEPFEDVPLTQKRSLPFHLVWPPGRDPVLPSSFHLSSGDVERYDERAAEIVRNERASALVVGDEVWVDELTRRGYGPTYGVCVAQRRRRGQVWMVLAGLTGPATYAAARLVKKMGTSLQRDDHGGNSPVYYTLIRGNVEHDRDPSDHPPYLTGQEIVQDTRAWPERSS